MIASDLELTMSLAAASRSGPRTEDSLLARLRNGEVSAVGEAYDLHHAAVRSFALRLVGDEFSAEDLVHETFVSLPQAIKGFRADSSLRTFLISVAVNHARHHVRAAARRRAAHERYAEEPSGDATTPEAELRRAQLARVLVRALDTLPIEQRVAFVLCEVEDQTSGEAAAIVGVPESTVRTRLFHAKKKLRAILEKEGIQ